VEINHSFTKLTISGWRQFKAVEFDFHSRLTIVTGANGAGKSTILKILKSHFAHEKDETFLATPVIEKEHTRFSLGGWFATPAKPAAEGRKIGRIEYSSGQICNIRLPDSGKMEYALERDMGVVVSGISIGSHRANPRYEQLKSMPIAGLRPAEAYADFFEVQRTFNERKPYFKDGNSRQVNPVAAIKEALISFATFGVGNRHVTPVAELVGLFDRFQDILKTVLPAEVGFRQLEIRTPEVVVATSSGDFPIDGASGGLMSIIQLSWEIFLQAEINKMEHFVVLIDEPENHLHPSLQRTFLSNLLEAFPAAQFIVATHSPFVISSVKDSAVYALRHHVSDGSVFTQLAPRSVVSHKLDYVQKAGPASDILREVLGVPVTMPDWSAAELERIAAEFTSQTISSNSLGLLRAKLEAAGLSEFFPQAVARMKND